MRKTINRIIRTSHEGWLLVDISTAKHPDAAMYIDEEDWNYIQSLGYGRILAWESSKGGNAYATCNESNNKRDRHLIHSLLLSDSEMVDHKNHNGLDNRRKNLRDCNKSQNAMNMKIRCDNTSGIKGVCWSTKKKKWLARISIRNKTKNLGSFDDIEKAAEVRQAAEEKYFGKFAYQTK